MKDVGSIVRERLVASAASGVSSTLSTGIGSATTSLTIASGTGMPGTGGGVFAVKIGTELIQVMRSGTTLSVQTGGRGAFGTTAAAHGGGSTVTLAVLYDVVGIRVSELPPADNGSARIWMQCDGRPGAETGVVRVRATFRCFGGSKSGVDARGVYRLLHDRLQQIGQQSTTSGVVVLATEETGGQVMRDPDTEWLFVPAVYEVVVR